jgi:chromosome segregation ATPase
MSAYANGRGSQIFSFSAAATSAAHGEEINHSLPSLPQIGSELESFFSIARQIEAALVQERTNHRKLREEFRELQMKSSRFTTEYENKLKDVVSREEKLKGQISAHQQTEKSLHDQINEFCQQIDRLREEKKKAEIDLEILNSNFNLAKKSEESMKATIKSLQHSERSRNDHEQHLTRELSSIRNELLRYKRAWSQISAIDHKAKQALERSADLTRKFDEISDEWRKEKTHREKLQEQLHKEKREKQVALTCLHTTEARLSQVTRELEEIRKQQMKRMNDGKIELKF